MKQIKQNHVTKDYSNKLQKSVPCTILATGNKTTFELKCKFIRNASGFSVWNICSHFFARHGYFSDANRQQCTCCGRCVPTVSKSALYSFPLVTEHRHSSSLDVCSCTSLRTMEQQYHGQCAVWEHETSFNRLPPVPKSSILI